MMIRFLQYLMFFTGGIILGYWLFSPAKSTPSEEHVTQDIIAEESSIEQNHLKSTQNDSKPAQDFVIDSAKLTKNQDDCADENTLSKMQQLTQNQQQQIARLQAELAQQLKPADSSRELKLAPDGIETLSMNDFEKKMRDQFLDRFKGYAIELEGKRLEDMRAQFNNISGQADWSAEYESALSQYIQQADPERRHYVEQLSCNTEICRLKVSTNEPQSWNRLFLNMTRQDWYKSITLSEKSDDPNAFTYYITRPEQEKRAEQ